MSSSVSFDCPVDRCRSTLALKSLVRAAGARRLYSASQKIGHHFGGLRFVAAVFQSGSHRADQAHSASSGLRAPSRGGALRMCAFLDDGAYKRGAPRIAVTRRKEFANLRRKAGRKLPSRRCNRFGCGLRNLVEQFLRVSEPGRSCRRVPGARTGPSGRGQSGWASPLLRRSEYPANGLRLSVSSKVSRVMVQRSFTAHRVGQVPVHTQQAPGCSDATWSVMCHARSVSSRPATNSRFPNSFGCGLEPRCEGQSL